jgi:hypothetical protein
MGGPALFSGTETQADVSAFVCVYILARSPLGWVHLSVPDVPVSVSCETGGPGDDIGIEILRSSVRVEVQSKRGLTRGKPLAEALQHIARRLPTNTPMRVVLAVDPSTSKAIRSKLRLDLRRLAQGRSDGVSLRLAVRDTNTAAVSTAITVIREQRLVSARSTSTDKRSSWRGSTLLACPSRAIE